jgi:hypothetical protein
MIFIVTHSLLRCFADAAQRRLDSETYDGQDVVS